MDRDKLSELIENYLTENESFTSDKLAGHLIANGIGDITAEKHRADRAEKELEEAYEGIKKLQEFQLKVSRILGTTRKPMLEEIRELKHRAEMAEEALRNGAVGEDLYCSSDDERHRLYLHLIREAEQRLKEAESDNN